MTNKNPVNIPASVKQKLLNISRSSGRDFNQVLQRYGFERFLYRVSVSPHKERLILKGAMLFHIWSAIDVRPTKDMDFLGIGMTRPDSLHPIITDIFSTVVHPDDGLVFDKTSIEIVQIREQQTYHGLRATFTCMLGNARIPLQMDVGFGSKVVPAPQIVDYPTLLDSPTPRIRAYARETSIAEKLEAMIHHGIFNGRAKDYYDIWYMAGHFEYQGGIMCDAIRSVLSKSGDRIPDGLPIGLSEEFGNNPSAIIRWKAFLSKRNLSDAPAEFNSIVSYIKEFLSPPLESVSRGDHFEQFWPIGGPWQNAAMPQQTKR